MSIIQESIHTHTPPPPKKHRERERECTNNKGYDERLELAEKEL